MYCKVHQALAMKQKLMQTKALKFRKAAEIGKRLNLTVMRLDGELSCNVILVTDDSASHAKCKSEEKKFIGAKKCCYNF